MKIVIVSPHRDDAAFSLALSVDAWFAAGHKVQVLNCFTQSDYAPFSDVESLHANDRVSFVSAVRRREDIAWNKLEANRLQFNDLDLLDAPLRLACTAGEVLTVDIRAGDRAVARVTGAIAKLARNAPSEGLAFAVPLAVGGHIDHRVVRRAALEALAGSPLPFAFYEDLPYAARPGEAGGLGSCAAEMDLALLPVFATAASVNVEEKMARKRRIAECYDSQVDSEDVRLIAEFCAGYDGRERLWANPAWLGSALALGADSGN